MKKVQRKNPGIDYLKQFSKFARELGAIRYDSNLINAFAERVDSELIDSLALETRLLGLRIEHLFQTVVTSIGSVRLIKSEDEGDAYFSGEEISIPDYRTVLEDGRRILVEVKSVSGKKFKLSAKAVARLRRYAELDETTLFFALCWQEYKCLWTLHPVDFLSPSRGSVNIGFFDALMENHMHLVGDCSLLIKAPLVFRVILKVGEGVDISGSDQSSFIGVPQELQVVSEGRVLTHDTKEFAYRVLFFGDWREIGTRVTQSRDMVFLETDYGPPEIDAEQNEKFGCFAGRLSEFVSNSSLFFGSTVIHTPTGDLLMPGDARNLIPARSSIRINRAIQLPRSAGEPRVNER